MSSAHPEENPKPWVPAGDTEIMPWLRCPKCGHRIARLYCSMGKMTACPACKTQLMPFVSLKSVKVLHGFGVIKKSTGKCVYFFETEKEAEQCIPMLHKFLGVAVDDYEVREGSAPDMMMRTLSGLSLALHFAMEIARNEEDALEAFEIEKRLEKYQG